MSQRLLAGVRSHFSSPKEFFVRYGLFFVLAILCVYFWYASPFFMTGRNFINIFVSISVIGTIAAAMTLAIIGRGPDLTVGAVCAMVGCIQANLVLLNGYPWYIGMLAALGIGLLVGFLNGIIIVKFNLAPFIVTLGMMNVVRGLCFVLTNGLAHFINIPQLVFLGRERWFDIPVSIVVLVVCFIAFEFISRKTVFGRQVYACGGNRVAARLAGINVDKIGVLLFMLTGFMAAVAGTIVVGISGAALPQTGDGYPLDAITAILLGGTTLAGGSGSVRRTFLGLLIIGVLNNGMALLNVQTYWQVTAKGAFLLAAIILDSLQHRSK